MKFVFVGDGEIRELLKTRVQQLGLTDNVFQFSLVY